MNSPDFWRWGNRLCPDHRGYLPTFRTCLNPIGGEYLEIPSTTVIHNHRYRHEQKGGEVGLMAFELIEKQRVGLLISFSVGVCENV